MGESGRSAGIQILIVDDEADQVEMYQYALEEEGFRVVTASSGEAALAHARTDKPDVIVLDVRLPDMNGLEVCTILKNDPATADIPIVIITAAASPTIAQDAEQVGCAAHLLKPCYPDDLTRAIRHVLAAA